MTCSVFTIVPLSASAAFDTTNPLQTTVNDKKVSASTSGDFEYITARPLLVL